MTAGGATLQLAANLSTPNTLVIGAGGVSVDTLTNTATFAGALSGTGGLTKLGTGTLALNAVTINAITAAQLTVNAGSVIVGANGTNCRRRKSLVALNHCKGILDSIWTTTIS